MSGLGQAVPAAATVRAPAGSAGHAVAVKVADSPAGAAAKVADSPAGAAAKAANSRASVAAQVAVPMALIGGLLALWWPFGGGISTVVGVVAWAVGLGALMTAVGRLATRGRRWLAGILAVAGSVVLVDFVVTLVIWGHFPAVDADRRFAALWFQWCCGWTASDRSTSAWRPTSYRPALCS